jgi:hypothetical protein
MRAPIATLCLLAACAAMPAHARTVYRCVRDGTVSLSTAPEPGSKCVAKQIDDNAAKVPNLWGNLGVVKGTLYERQQDGKTVYGTRKLAGFDAGARLHRADAARFAGARGPGRTRAAAAQALQCRISALREETGVEDAMLRAFAHAESGFDPMATSSKGAQGVMQLMPEVAREYAVADPYSAAQSIDGGARHLKQLMMRYKGDLDLVAAALQRRHRHRDAVQGRAAVSRNHRIRREGAGPVRAIPQRDGQADAGAPLSHHCCGAHAVFTQY